MNQPLPPEKLEEIKQALYRGEKIAAIKLHRNSTGAGLKESKEAVEFLESELRKKSPEKFTAAPSGKGCLGVLATVALAGIMVAVVIITAGRSN